MDIEPPNSPANMGQMLDAEAFIDIDEPLLVPRNGDGDLSALFHDRLRGRLQPHADNPEPLYIPPQPLDLFMDEIVLVRPSIVPKPIIQIQMPIIPPMIPQVPRGRYGAIIEIPRVRPPPPTSARKIVHVTRSVTHLPQPTVGLLTFYIQRDIRRNGEGENHNVIIGENNLLQLADFFGDGENSGRSKYEVWSRFLRQQNQTPSMFTRQFYLKAVAARTVVAAFLPPVPIINERLMEEANSEWLDLVEPNDIRQVIRALYNGRLQYTTNNASIIIDVPALGLKVQQSDFYGVGHLPGVVDDQIAYVAEIYLQLLNEFPFDAEHNIMYAIGLSFEGSTVLSGRTYINVDLPEIAARRDMNNEDQHNAEGARMIINYTNPGVLSLADMRVVTELFNRSHPLSPLFLAETPLDHARMIRAVRIRVMRVIQALIAKYAEDVSLEIVISSLRFLIKPFQVYNQRGEISVSPMIYGSSLKISQTVLPLLTEVTTRLFSPQAPFYFIPRFLLPYMLNIHNNQRAKSEIETYRVKSCRHTFIFDYLVYMRSLENEGLSFYVIASLIWGLHKDKLIYLDTQLPENFLSEAIILFDLLDTASWFIVSQNFTSFSFPVPLQDVNAPVIMLFYNFSYTGFKEGVSTVFMVPDHITFTSMGLINKARSALLNIKNITEIIPKNKEGIEAAWKVRLKIACVNKVAIKPFKLNTFYWDIETFTTPDRPPYLVCAINEEGEKLSFQGPNCIKLFLEGINEWAVEHKVRSINFWSYNGSRFDNAYLLPYLYKADVFGSLQDTKYLIIYLKDVKLNLYDFALTMGFGLQKTFVSLGGNPNDGKGAFDVKKINIANYEDHIEEAEEYCFQDCLTLFKCIKLFIASLTQMNYTPPNTWISAASLALTLFRGYFIEKDSPLIIGLGRTEYEILKSSYYGGYSQVYNQKLINGYSYDINSSYPWAMCQEQPVKQHQFEIDDKCEFQEDGIYYEDHLIFLYLIKEYCFDAFVDSPCIPTRSDEGNFYRSKGVDVWVWGHTIAFCRENYGAHFTYTLGGFISFKGGKPFEKYVDTFFAMKASAQEPINRTFAKLMLNSLYGKFGQDEFGTSTLLHSSLSEELNKILTDPIRQISRVTPHKSYYGGVIMHLIEHANSIIPAHTGAGVQIASHIASLSRLKLFKMILDIQNQGGEVAYCDTDSVYCSIKLEGEDIDDKKLGAWKLEASIKEGRFYGAKNYILQTDKNEFIHHLKGIPKKYITNDILQSIWDAEDGETIPIQIEELWKRTWGTVMGGSMIKKWRRTLTRRIFNSDNISSKPLV